MARKVKRPKVRRNTLDKLKPTSWDSLLSEWNALQHAVRTSSEPLDWSRYWSAWNAATKDDRDRMLVVIKKAISPPKQR